jgi:predicted RNase H-like HicB family nuclease
MLSYRVAFYYPANPGDLVYASVLDFPGVVSEGADVAEARLSIVTEIEAFLQMLGDEGQVPPVPDPTAFAPHADLVESVTIPDRGGTA